MPTFIKINSTTVGSGGAASIDFTSIPDTYTDLLLKVSGRSTESDNASSLRVYFNSDTSNVQVTELRGAGTVVASYRITYPQQGYVGATSSTASTFGSADIYIANYASTKQKSTSAEIVMPSTTAGHNYEILSNRTWEITSAITTITIAPGAGNWVENTIASLYGIKNS